jgi:hypothetical protein
VAVRRTLIRLAFPLLVSPAAAPSFAAVDGGAAEELPADQTVQDVDAVTPGHALAEAVYHRPDGETMAAFSRMTLTAPGSRERVREFYSYRADFPGDQSRALIRFVNPGNIAGTGLLIHNLPESPNDQWLFLPALERIRRVSGESRGGRFVQSVIYYEDLQDRRPGEDRHSLLGEGSYGDVAVQLLESLPRDPGRSAYSRRVSWIHPALKLPLRVDFYEGGPEPAKRFEVLRLEEIEGYWTATDTVFKALDSGEETRVVLLRVRYDTALPDGLFSTRALADPRSAEAFRP